MQLRTYFGRLSHFLFLFTPFILEPNSHHPRRQARHLRQLLLHEGVWPGVGTEAGLEDVQLLLSQDSPDLARPAPPLPLGLPLPSLLQVPGSRFGRVLSEGVRLALDVHTAHAVLPVRVVLSPCIAVDVPEVVYLRLDPAVLGVDVVVVLAPLQQLVVLLAIDPVPVEGELVPRHQVPSTGSTAKALEMKHFGLCSHNKIVLGKYPAAGRALGAVQPGVVLLTESLPISDKAGVSLVQQHVALGALEAGGVPGEVGRDSEDELVLDETSTADTGTAPITMRALRHPLLLSSQLTGGLLQPGAWLLTPHSKH